MSGSLLYLMAMLCCFKVSSYLESVGLIVYDFALPGLVLLTVVTYDGVALVLSVVVGAAM